MPTSKKHPRVLKRRRQAPKQAAPQRGTITVRSMHNIGMGVNPREGRIFRRKHDNRARRYGFPDFAALQQWWGEVANRAKRTIFRGRLGY